MISYIIYKILVVIKVYPISVENNVSMLSNAYNFGKELDENLRDNLPRSILIFPPD